MTPLDELKNKWDTQKKNSPLQPYNPATLEKIVKNRVRMHIHTSMQYFWAAFALQIIVYALLSHVLVKYWMVENVLFMGLSGVALYLPFTVVLMRKFKRMAASKPLVEKVAVASLYAYVTKQHAFLTSFYSFKKWYEFFLLPLSTALTVGLIFKLYVPGSVNEHWMGAVIIWGAALLACAAAVRSENKKSFEGPIRQLQNLLQELKAEF